VVFDEEETPRPFYSNTSYRDAYGSSYEPPERSLGISVKTGTIGAAGARSITGTTGLPGEVKTIPKSDAAYAKSRSVNAGATRTINFSRTAYREHFGLPHPIVAKDPAPTKYSLDEETIRAVTRPGGRERAAPVGVPRSLKLATAKDPRWPRGNVGKA
jgi:hypothetical protein